MINHHHYPDPFQLETSFNNTLNPYKYTYNSFTKEIVIKKKKRKNFNSTITKKFYIIVGCFPFIFCGQYA